MIKRVGAGESRLKMKIATSNVNMQESAYVQGEGEVVMEIGES